MNSGFVLDQRQNVTKFDPRGDKSCGVADFDAPSPAASPPREPQPAVEEPRSAPAVDAASAGGAVPETSACTACALGVGTPLHIKLPPSPSRSGGDSPQEEAVPKRSGEKPADETHRAATGSSASMPPSTSAPTREFVDSAWATYLRRQASETPSQTRDEASAWTNNIRHQTREYWERRRMEQLATVQTSPTESLSEDIEAETLSPSECRLMLWGLMEEMDLDEEERLAFLDQHAPPPALLSLRPRRQTISLRRRRRRRRRGPGLAHSAANSLSWLLLPSPPKTAPVAR